MAAIWKIRYIRDNMNDYMYIRAADAKSMKRKDLNAATRNAATRAKKRLEKFHKGARISIVDASCVG